MGLLNSEASLLAANKKNKSKAKRLSQKRWGGDLEKGESGFQNMRDRVDESLALKKGSKVGKGIVSLRGRGQMSIGAHKKNKYGIRDKTLKRRKSGKKSKGKKSKGKKSKGQ